jgi:hypothetical protein
MASVVGQYRYMYSLCACFLNILALKPMRTFKVMFLKFQSLDAYNQLYGAWSSLER